MLHNFLVDVASPSSEFILLEAGRSLMLVARSFSEAFKGSVGLLSEQHRTHLQTVMRNAMQYTAGNPNQEHRPGTGQPGGSHLTSSSNNIISTKISTTDSNTDINNFPNNLNMGPTSGIGINTVVNSTLAGDLSNNTQQSAPLTLSPPSIQTSGLKFDISKFKSSASASAAVLRPLGTFTRRTIVRESSETFSGKLNENDGEREVQNVGREDGEEGNDDGEKDGESRDGYNTNISNGEDSP